MTDANAGGLIRALQDPSLYDHPVREFQLHETHISWVILTGDYAYKIKKPLDFGFLDFSSLERRRHFCHEELRLNRRLAPDLYLDVVPITGSAESPRFGGEGDVFEYAIRMRQFDQSQLLDSRQQAGTLSPELLAELARDVAGFHASLPRAPADKPLGTPEAVTAAMQENFDQCREILNDPQLLAQLDLLEAWAQSTAERLTPKIAERHSEGHVRECHGDLHLANITVFNDQVTVFDCIEFSEPFRYIDVINDLAFLLMDLEARDEYALSSRVLNTYLEYSGDFGALPLLSMYKAYRAMVRAKIALLTMGNPELGEQGRQELLDRYAEYAELAESYTGIPDRYLLATTGLSGSGKSVVSQALGDQLGLIRLRSDVERKRLFGLAPLDSSRSATGEGLYTAEANQRTYDTLAGLSARLLATGLPVIVDSACLRQSEREQLEAVAESQGVPFVLLDCQVPDDVRRDWVRERDGDASEAGEDLLEQQNSWLEPLSEREKSHTIHINTTSRQAAQALAARIRAHLGLAGDTTGG